MPRHRSFDVARSADRQEPLTFDVADQSFTCLHDAPAGCLLDVIAGDGRLEMAKVYRFFADVMVDGDYDRFVAAIHDRETIVPVDVLGEIVEWLCEEYGGRPTGPSSSSEPGRSNGGTSLTAAAPSPV